MKSGEHAKQFPVARSIRQHADVSIHQHTSAYVSLRQHTSAYVQSHAAYVSIRQCASAYVSIRQHMRCGEPHVKALLMLC
jgi:hypothetical protein